jgi:signal peptidase I
MKWFGPALVLVTAIAILIKRREFAAFQANVLGGSILPGCAVAEAVVLFVIAALLFLLA